MRRIGGLVEPLLIPDNLLVPEARNCADMLGSDVEDSCIVVYRSIGLSDRLFRLEQRWQIRRGRR